MNSSISNFDRLPDWDLRLADVTTGHVDIAPEWGLSDCLLTAADAIYAVVGTDPLAEFRAKYTTEQGAAKLMLKNKCADVEEVFEKYLGLTSVGRLSARRGDVGVIIINDQPTAGYFMELGFAVKQPNGLSYFPITDVKTAFQIGRR